ncbi:hypothetical protein M405DRAFT_348658 [Rhizopogon salebrosus TDB-379]|nr:hypothetical protein M405DRAFT_348658 [Rhizopogon salebrosus TDB-379]
MSDQGVTNLYWNNYTSVIIFTLISYDYLLLFEKEVAWIWKRQWSLMSCLYLVVRYLGLFLALLCGCWGGLWYMPESVSYDLAVLIEWGFSVYFCFAEVILICRLSTLYHQPGRLFHVLLAMFLPIVALEIGTDIYFDRDSTNSGRQVLHPLLQPRAYDCDLYFHPHHML